MARTIPNTRYSPRMESWWWIVRIFILLAILAPVLCWSQDNVTTFASRNELHEAVQNGMARLYRAHHTANAHPPNKAIGEYVRYEQGYAFMEVVGGNFWVAISDSVVCHKNGKVMRMKMCDNFIFEFEKRNLSDFLYRIGQNTRHIQGERGLTGLKGERGQQGPKGERGERGPQGERGPAGKDGRVVYVPATAKKGEEEDSDGGISTLGWIGIGTGAVALISGTIYLLSRGPKSITFGDGTAE